LKSLEDRIKEILETVDPDEVEAEAEAAIEAIKNKEHLVDIKQKGMDSA